MKKEDVLSQCRVEGVVIKLPDIQLDRSLYVQVKKSLEQIGGVWKGGKIAGFVFKTDPTDLLQQVANGENRNLKKEFQFFETPDDVADWLISLADINDSVKIILEPSAGHGAIIKALLRAGYDGFINCFEIQESNKLVLANLKVEKLFFVGNDFLVDHTNGDILCYDRIIANPPFSKNQDIDHIQHMYACLKQGGKLVSIASKHWQLSQNKKETAFRHWLKEVNAEVHEIDAGKFKKSGTMVSTVAIVINK